MKSGRTGPARRPGPGRPRGRSAQSARRQWSQGSWRNSHEAVGEDLDSAYLQYGWERGLDSPDWRTTSRALAQPGERKPPKACSLWLLVADRNTSELQSQSNI